MDQQIVGFHQDQERHWVAELACGHNQHVRHDPPWTQRPWVVTPEGRAMTLGKTLPCRLCGAAGRGSETEVGGPGAAPLGSVDRRPPTMSVRPARPADARRIAEIHVRTWQAAYAGIVPAAYLASLSVDRHEAMWAGHLRTGSPALLVAGDGGSIGGWVAFGPSRDEGAAPDVAEIWALYVDTAHWARGVGRALWAGAQARLREQGFAHVGLWAFPQNERAGRFYRSLGFQVEAGSAKEFELGGASIDEVRYIRGLA